MNVVRNVIASAGASNACSNQNYDGFVWNLFGNYYDFSAGSDEALYLLFSNEYFEVGQVKGECESPYLLFGDSGTYLLRENGKLIPSNTKKKEVDYLIGVYESYTVTLNDIKEYVFSDNETNESFVRKNDDKFLGEFEGCFYFYCFELFDGVNRIVKTNFEFDEVECFELGDLKISGFCSAGRFAFCIETGSALCLRVFDFQSFTFVDSKVEVDDINPKLYQNDNSTLIFVGGHLYVWNNKILEKYSFDKIVSDHLVLNERLCLCFLNDPNLYVFNLDTLELIAKRRVTKDGFYPFQIHPRGDWVYLSCYSSIGSIDSCLVYFAKLKQTDVLSSKEWQVHTEELLVETVSVKEGELFSILLKAETVSNYGTLVRHIVSAASDAVSKHALYESGDPETTTESFSKNFNGKIKILISNSLELSEEQKITLENSVGNIVAQLSLSVGFANGSNLPLDINCEFID